MTTKRFMGFLVIVCSTTLLFHTFSFSEASVNSETELIITDWKHALISIPQNIPGGEDKKDYFEVISGRKSYEEIKVTNQMKTPIRVSMTDYDDDDICLACKEEIEINPGDEGILKIEIKAKHKQNTIIEADDSEAVYPEESFEANESNEKNIRVSFNAVWNGGSSEIESNINIKIINSQKPTLITQNTPAVDLLLIGQPVENDINNIMDNANLEKPDEVDSKNTIISMTDDNLKENLKNEINQ